MVPIAWKNPRRINESGSLASPFVSIGPIMHVHPTMINTAVIESPLVDDSALIFLSKERGNMKMIENLYHGTNGSLYWREVGVSHREHSMSYIVTMNHR